MSDERSEEGIESTALLCPFCGSDKVATEYDIGFDIDPSGEERQHMDRCECGAWRFHIDRIHGFTTPKKHIGKWHSKDDDKWPLF